MISRALVPLDGSEMATHALEYALDAHPDADITVLHVVGEPSPMMEKVVSLVLEEDVSEAAEALAEEVFEPARELAAERGVELDTAVGLGQPARNIVEYAADFDVVIMGSHSGDPASRLFVGNVANAVVRRSPVPVTVVR